MIEFLFYSRPRLIGTFSVVALLLLLTVTVQTVFAQPSSVDLCLDRALEWIINSKFIVRDPSDPIYSNTYPPLGGVFLVYDMSKSEFGNRIHIPAAAEYVKLTADLAQQAHNQTVINNLKLVADFLMASTAQVNFEEEALTAVGPVWLYKDERGWILITEESYTRDQLNVALALLQAYQVAKNEGYASRARGLLNTVIVLQSFMDEKIQEGDLPDWTSGSLPWILYNYEQQSSYEVTYSDLDLSLTDVVWGAFTLGYNIFRDDRYLKTRDRYFDFVERAYAMTENTPLYPYQFISDRAEGKLYFANYDTIEKDWGPLKPFTADMAFYQVTGLLMNENETYRSLGREFLYNLSLLQNQYYFDDSYYPNGTAVGYGNASIVTGQYSVALSLDGKSDERNQIQDAMFHNQLYDSSEDGTMVYNGAWEWSPGARLVESMASIVMIHSLIFNPSMIPKTETSGFSHINVIVIIVGTLVILAMLTVFILTRLKSQRRLKKNDFSR